MNISTRAIVKVLLVTAALVAILYGMYLTRGVLTWIVIAFSLALALNPAVAWLARQLPGHSRGVATLVVFLVLMSSMGLLLFTLVPPVVMQSEQLIDNVPEYTQQLTQPGTWSGDLIERYDLISRIQQSQNDLLSRVTNASGSFVGVVTEVFSSLIALITILGLAFFMLVEGPTWIAMFWRIQPERRRTHWQELGEEMYRAMVGYVNGKILLAFLAGLSAAIMLIILGIPYAAALALVVGLLSIIPVFGATIAAVIVVIICLFNSAAAAIIMAIFFFVYQQIENYITQPIIFKKTVDVSPLLVFISVLIGTAAGGILGALIAIPLTASIQILARDFYSHRQPKVPD